MMRTGQPGVVLTTVLAPSDTGGRLAPGGPERQAQWLTEDVRADGPLVDLRTGEPTTSTAREKAGQLAGVVPATMTGLPGGAVRRISASAAVAECARLARDLKPVGVPPRAAASVVAR